ncbi:MAG TPA: hypothetical protein VIK91_24265, partial [Nannocystis sp.]
MAVRQVELVERVRRHLRHLDRVPRAVGVGLDLHVGGEVGVDVGDHHRVGLRVVALDRVVVGVDRVVLAADRRLRVHGALAQR